MKKFFYIGILGLMMGNVISNSDVYGKLVGITAPDKFDVYIQSTDQSGRVTIKGSPNQHPAIQNVHFKISDLQDFTFTIPYENWDHPTKGKPMVVVGVYEKGTLNPVSVIKIQDIAGSIKFQYLFSNSSETFDMEENCPKIDVNGYVEQCASILKQSPIRDQKSHLQIGTADVDVDIKLEIDNNGKFIIHANKK